jgi:hypothetical protein
VTAAGFDLALALAAMPTAAMGGTLIWQFMSGRYTRWIWVDVCVWSLGMTGVLVLVKGGAA